MTVRELIINLLEKDPVDEAPINLDFEVRFATALNTSWNILSVYQGDKKSKICWLDIEEDGD